MRYEFKIKYMDINEIYFKGKVEFCGDEYIINF